MGKRIRNLSGIEFFDDLQSLWCDDNYLTELDLSNNRELSQINCGWNYLTELDVSGLTKLKTLYCYRNYFESPDSIIGWQSNPELVLDRTFLFYPQSSGKMPEGLDITDSFTDSAFLAIVRDMVKRPDGPIYDFDVCKIDLLAVSYQNIESLSGIEHFYNLKTLICSGNRISELDLSNNAALTGLVCDNNRLTELNISNNPALETIHCQDNMLERLDVSKKPALQNLYCTYNQLAELDLSESAELLDLYCYNNRLTALNIINCRELVHLSCSSNLLGELDISGNIALAYLDCAMNRLSGLDTSNNHMMAYLYCNNNELMSLDVSSNSILTNLVCSDNLLERLDISGNPILSYLICMYNFMGPDPDIGVPGWRNNWLTPDSWYGFVYYPQYSPSDMLFVKTDEYNNLIVTVRHTQKDDSVLIAAAYNDIELLECMSYAIDKSCNIIIESGSLPYNADNVKIMLWHSAEGLKPLCPAKSFVKKWYFAEEAGASGRIFAFVPAIE